jgi:hypothetical protein
MTKMARNAMRDGLEKLGKFETALHAIRDRLEHLSAYAGIIAAGAREAFSYLQKKTSERKKKKENTDE